MNIEDKFNNIQIKEAEARASERARKAIVEPEVVSTNKGKGKVDAIPEIVPESEKEKSLEPEKENSPEAEIEKSPKTLIATETKEIDITKFILVKSIYEEEEEKEDDEDLDIEGSDHSYDDDRSDSDDEMPKYSGEGTEDFPTFQESFDEEMNDLLKRKIEETIKDGESSRLDKDQIRQARKALFKAMPIERKFRRPLAFFTRK
ncbi:hypothetical protein Hanom_Chr03g00210611 [Helianthus anomalus]